MQVDSQKNELVIGIVGQYLLSHYFTITLTMMKIINARIRGIRNWKVGSKNQLFSVEEEGSQLS